MRYVYLNKRFVLCIDTCGAGMGNGLSYVFIMVTCVTSPAYGYKNSQHEWNIDSRIIHALGNVRKDYRKR